MKYYRVLCRVLTRTTLNGAGVFRDVDCVVVLSSVHRWCMCDEVTWAVEDVHRRLSEPQLYYHDKPQSESFHFLYGEKVDFQWTRP